MILIGSALVAFGGAFIIGAKPLTRDHVATLQAELTAAKETAQSGSWDSLLAESRAVRLHRQIAFWNHPAGALLVQLFGTGAACAGFALLCMPR